MQTGEQLVLEQAPSQAAKQGKRAMVLLAIAACAVAAFAYAQAKKKRVEPKYPAFKLESTAFAAKGELTMTDAAPTPLDRSLFAVTDRSSYLNHASAGTLSRPAVEAGTAFLHEHLGSTFTATV